MKKERRKAKAYARESRVVTEESERKFAELEGERIAMRDFQFEEDNEDGERKAKAKEE